MNQVTSLYQDLIDEFKNKGYKLYHGKRKISGGMCHWDEKFIHVASEFRNTLYGCYLLAHELGHVCDHIDNKYPTLFLKRFHGKPIPISYVRYVEWSAIQFAKNILKDRRLKTSSIKIFDKRVFEQNLDWWWMRYNNIKESDYEKIKKSNNRAA